MSVMLSNHLAKGAQLRRCTVVRPYLPHNPAIPSHNRHNRRRPAADHHVLRSEAFVAFVIPVVWPHIRRRIHVEPVERAPPRTSATDCLASILIEMQILDVVAYHPFP